MGQGKSGGKHGPVSTLRGFTPNDAGVPREAGAGGAPIKREFIGSGMKQYTYTRVINGIKRTETFSAHNVEEADRIAKSLGYKANDRKVKKRKKRKR